MVEMQRYKIVEYAVEGLLGWAGIITFYGTNQKGGRFFGFCFIEIEIQEPAKRKNINDVIYPGQYL